MAGFNEGYVEGKRFVNTTWLITFFVTGLISGVMAVLVDPPANVIFESILGLSGGFALVAGVSYLYKKGS